MQCTSFLPGLYCRDLNVGANAAAWTLYNNERALNNGHSHNVFLPLLTKDQFSVNDKEVLRQTILQHESIFREQVHELHRLYRRQRELMDDTKRRRLSTQNIQCQSNALFPKISSESTQRNCQIPSLPWVNPAASRLYFPSAGNFQPTSCFSERKSTQASPDAPKIENNLKEGKLSRSMCHKPKRKMFDLELPADEYVDSEEEDRFEVEKASKVPELLCYPAKRMQEVSQKSDLELLPCAGPLNSICRGVSSSPDPISGKSYDLADLNEPLLLEDEVASNAMDLNMPPSCLRDLEVSQQNVGTEDGEKSKPNEEREHSSQKDLIFSQAFSTSVCDTEPKRLKTNKCLGNEQILGSSTDQIFALASSSNSRPDASEDKDIKSTNKAVVLDINSAGCPVLKSGEQCTTDDASIGIIVDNKIQGVGNQIDLNCCISECECSPELSIPMIIKTVAEIDLEAPVSPENKECSPPRGESEENPPETPIKLAKGEEDSEQKNEFVRTAAEAIVLISTTGFSNLGLENIDCETFKASHSDSLHWFAGVVSSLAGDLENEVGAALSGKDDGDKQEPSSDESDYFETMTLELTETKVEEYCSKSNGQKEEETGTDLSPSQPRRGRTLRGRQRKNFQTEVLPSLASLSRYEVTEDLQTIGGLMEAAGFLVGTSPGRRYPSRNACSRSRRRLGDSFCHGMESTVCSTSKQRNGDSDFPFGERSLKGWGKMNRRRRGPRIPASNTPLVFS